MNKRIKKKYLTADEKKVLELYHAAQAVEFKSFVLESDEARKLTERLGEGSHFNKYNSSSWFRNVRGKIEVTGYVIEEE
ncbi:hypothetical protein [Listeria booriae]|uniref:hypothetical protein n=1 Tax=Listeria booriae TaxID=1552123 RepID=UPI001625A8D1|nr:hypothetical protein [Listeria booriae]MBC1982812.1 hypothetical protein [Listeria booriae]